MPTLFIVAGPNGAGKSTYVKRFLPREMKCREFVNADLIAAGLSPFAPDQVAFEAARIMLRRLRDLSERRQDFSFETTLTGFGHTHLLREMKEAGYRIRLDYLWIPNLDITRGRVKQRVKKDGHDIPDEVQQRRFGKGLRLLLEHHRPLVHLWRIHDNTGQDPHLVVEVPAEQLEPLARRILEVNGEPLPEAEERALLAHLEV